MASQSINNALDFLPEAKSTRLAQVAAALQAFAAALSEGRTAQVEYQRLVANGAGHSEAARIVFDNHFKS